VDPSKWARQLSLFGNSLQGMPPPTVMYGKRGRLVLFDGVTRAARAAKLLPGVQIAVTLYDDPGALRYDEDRLPTI
jgi:hypothetical protein